MTTDPYNYVPEAAHASAPLNEGNNTTLVAKHSTVGGDEGAYAGNRSQAYERNGASYAPTASLSYPNAPEAANTLRNVRILPPAGRPFWDARAATGQGIN